jgi:hypothetical protein
VTDNAAAVKLALSLGGDDFDRIFPGQTDRFAMALGRAYSELLAVFDRFKEPSVASRRRGPRDHYSVPWTLLWDACNGLLGSFSLLQRGYETETLAASRVVVERVTVALVLFDNPDLVDPFMGGQIDDLPNRSIGAAKKVVPDLAKWWGALSDVGSHVSPANIGTGVWSKKGEPLRFVIGGRLREDSEGFQEVAGLMSEMANQLLAEAPTLTFFNERRRRAELTLRS